VSAIHSTMTAPIDAPVDVASLRDRVAGQRDLLRRLLDVFHEQYPSQIALLRAASEQGVAAEMRRAAHRLIGTLSCFSATQAIAAARAVEQAAARDEIEAARVGIAAIEREVTRAMPLLARLAAQGFEAPDAGRGGS
jgi:HPt (histidine-containing phosphotransfer) domain-containing protein